MFDGGAIAVGTLAATVATKLAPFMPFLIDMGKAGASKLAEMVAEAGGKAAWEKAQAIWAKITSTFGKDPKLQSAATLLAESPDDEDCQTMLAKVLGNALQNHPELVQEIFDLVGGSEAVQEVIAERGSWVENVGQKLQGAGSQTIRASDQSTIKGVRQEGTR